MNKPIFPKPKSAAAAPKAEAETQRRRARKWAGLHDALALLEQARTIAGAEPADEPKPAGEVE